MGFLDFFRKKRHNLPANHETPNFKVLAEKTHFTKKELAAIYERFLSLCNYETGMLEKVPFVQQPELALNPIIDLAYDMECQNFLNLRLLLIKKKNDEEEKELLESLARHEAERNAQGVSSPEEVKRRRHKRSKRKRNKKKNKHLNSNADNGDGSLESLDQSLESMEGSLESLDDSLDESLDSIDGEHVYSVDLSVDNTSTKGVPTEELPESVEKKKSDTSDDGENDMRDEEYENSDQKVSNNEEDENSKLEDKKDDDKNEENGNGESSEENKSDAGDDDDSVQNASTNEEIEKSMSKSNGKDEKDDDKNGNEDEDSFKERKSDDNGDGDDTIQSHEKTSGVEEQKEHDNSIDSSDNENIKTENENIVADKGDAITTDEKEKNEGEEREEDDVEEDTAPPLLPMTSSFFRAQERLRKLDAEKRRAGIPPDGIDFTHFVLILNEFSPKASVSSKTSYFFKIIAVNNTGCISKEEYLEYLKRITYGLVPPYLYDAYIDDLWEHVCSKLVDGEREITRKMFSNFVSTIDVNLFMTIPF